MLWAMSISKPAMEAPRSRITCLVGVYDADSTLRGELAYWVGARLGRRHCSLCDITHGSIRRRPEWIACQAGLPMPFRTYHLNDRPDHIRLASDDHAPVVVAETDSGPVLMLTPAELEQCAGSADRLVDALERAAARLGLAWTIADGATTAPEPPETTQPFDGSASGCVDLG
jgi:hypothetical protein